MAKKIFKKMDSFIKPLKRYSKRFLNVVSALNKSDKTIPILCGSATRTAKIAIDFFCNPHFTL